MGRSPFFLFPEAPSSSDMWQQTSLLFCTGCATFFSIMVCIIIIFIGILLLLVLTYLLSLTLILCPSVVVVVVKKKKKMTEILLIHA